MIYTSWRPLGKAAREQRPALLTQLIAVDADDILEKDTIAKRNEPAGTGAGGVMSATRP
jgi:hypothetical protein